MHFPAARTRRLPILLSGCLLFSGFFLVAQTVPRQADGERTIGQPWRGERGISQTTEEIMARPETQAVRKEIYLKREFEIPGREKRVQDPNSPSEAGWPVRVQRSISSSASAAETAPSTALPQTVGTNFGALTGPLQNGAFPPDTMGAVGPTQFVLFVNGRMSTFNKTTGAADNVLSADPDQFFASVMTPAPVN